MTCLKCRKSIKNRNIYGLHTSCYKNWFNLSDISHFDHLDPKKQDSSASLPHIKKTTDTFYHGQYLKYSAQLNGVKYILKMQQEKYPDIPGMEYTCNQIAALLNLKVPQYYLIKFQETSGRKRKPRQTLTFVTKNFMQNLTGTLNHIYKFLPKGDQHYNCKQLIKIIQKQTQDTKEVKRIIEICLFDALIGNNDRHGRNLGLINTGKNKTLAPMYDNPSYIGTAQEELLDIQFNISGCIQTSDSKEPKVKDYLKEFRQLGFSKVCAHFIERLINVSPKIIEEVNNSTISQRRKKAFIKYLNSRIKDFQDD